MMDYCKVNKPPQSLASKTPPNLGSIAAGFFPEIPILSRKRDGYRISTTGFEHKRGRSDYMILVTNRRW